METPPAHTLNLFGVLSESKRIILTNYSHFIALSLLFLPLALSLIISPNLPLTDEFITVDHFHQVLPNHQKLLITYLPSILIVYILSFCAVATITYSTHHAFFGEPINILSALKSLIFSFFPLISTAIVAHLLLFLISLSFLLFVGSIMMLVQNLGFVIDYRSVYFMWFSVVVVAILIVIIVNFHLNWSLAFVVVVVESKWGFSPLKRSSYLVKGMRSVSLLVMLYIGVFSGLMVSMYSDNLYVLNGWVFVLVTMLACFFLMMLMSRITAANTVLYNYCRALHGELAIEVAEGGFVHEYVNLPSDVEKVPLVVAVVAAS